MMRLLFVILITVWTGVAHGQDAKVVVRPSPAFEACTAKESSTVGMENCAEVETARWDKRLNAAYGQIMASPNWNKATKDLVRNAQRGWLSYRNAKCVAAGELEAEGGTLSRVTAAICISDETALRAVELESALTPH